jgi:hypothetical protein
MKRETIRIVLPPTASSDIDLDLCELTGYLSKKLNLETGFGLGGEDAYGVDFENDTFMMHHYCWCDQEEKCLWCMMNDPAENKNYKKMKAELKSKYNSYWQEWGGAPTFFYKPTKIGCRWYKWIDRDTEWDKEPTKKEWQKIYKDCIESVKLK